MWMLDNTTAYSAERNWTRDKSGAHHWIVAVKATFDITPNGQLKLADEQAPPLLAPEYHGDPRNSSLKLDSDLLAIKPGTDIVADAHAHAPQGRPATTVPVSLRIGPIQKTLLVHGPRLYYRGVGGALSITAPQPFVKQAIRYELAFGGMDLSNPDPRKQVMDARNPIGKGIASDPSSLDHKSAHSIEYPRGNPANIGPAGFGPIDSSWSPRREFAGTYDEAWASSKKPLLPDDYDDRFGLCSPTDQRPVSFLQGGELVEASNLSDNGSLRFALPKIFLTFRTSFGTRHEEHRGRLVTVILEPDRRRTALVWQTSLRVKAPDVEYLDKTRVGEKPYAT